MREARMMTAGVGVTGCGMRNGDAAGIRPREFLPV
jgi:hypothetical protein